MGRWMHPRGLGALALLTVVLAACGAPGEAHVDYAVHHDNIGELVATGVAVVVGRVAQTSRGRIIDEEDVVYTVMNVEVAVEQTWAGQMPTSAFTIERFGWEQVARRPGWRGWFDFAGEREWRVEGELRLKQGDRGVFFLAREPHPPGWAVLGPEGLYLIDGAELADTGRADLERRMSVCEPGIPLDRGLDDAIRIYQDRVQAILLLACLTIAILVLGLSTYLLIHLVISSPYLLVILSWGLLLLGILGVCVAILLIAYFFTFWYPDWRYRSQSLRNPGCGTLSEF